MSKYFKALINRAAPKEKNLDNLVSGWSGVISRLQDNAPVHEVVRALPALLKPLLKEAASAAEPSAPLPCFLYALEQFVFDEMVTYGIANSPKGIVVVVTGFFADLVEKYQGRILHQSQVLGALGRLIQFRLTAPPLNEEAETIHAKMLAAMCQRLKMYPDLIHFMTPQALELHFSRGAPSPLTLPTSEPRPVEMVALYRLLGPYMHFNGDSGWWARTGVADMVAVASSLSSAGNKELMLNTLLTERFPKMAADAALSLYTEATTETVMGQGAKARASFISHIRFVDHMILTAPEEIREQLLKHIIGMFLNNGLCKDMCNLSLQKDDLRSVEVSTCLASQLLSEIKSPAFVHVLATSMLEYSLTGIPDKFPPHLASDPREHRLKNLLIWRTTAPSMQSVTEVTIHLLDCLVSLCDYAVMCDLVLHDVLSLRHIHASRRDVFEVPSVQASKDACDIFSQYFPLAGCVNSPDWDSMLSDAYLSLTSTHTHVAKWPKHHVPEPPSVAMLTPSPVTSGPVSRAGSVGGAPSTPRRNPTPLLSAGAGIDPLSPAPQKRPSDLQILDSPTEINGQEDARPTNVASGAAALLRLGNPDTVMDTPPPQSLGVQVPRASCTPSPNPHMVVPGTPLAPGTPAPGIGQYPEGYFMSAMLDRLGAFAITDYRVNLRVTGILKKLAAFPHPAISSFLLDPTFIPAQTAEYVVNAPATTMVKVSRQIEPIFDDFGDRNSRLAHARHSLGLSPTAAGDPALALHSTPGGSGSQSPPTANSPGDDGPRTPARLPSRKFGVAPSRPTPEENGALNCVILGEFARELSALIEARAMLMISV